LYSTLETQFFHIALDPAGPRFHCMRPEGRLSEKDAKFVQVIHTNGGKLLNADYGTLQPMGHVDIFVNDGKSQPGCDFENFFKNWSYGKCSSNH